MKKIKASKKIKNGWQLWVWRFVISSLLGWIYEVCLNVYYHHPFENRGFLWGPYLPIYGFGGCLLVLMFGKMVQRKITWGKISITPLLVFILNPILPTVLEYVTGTAMVAIFNRRWWDYSQEWGNLAGHICPLASFRFAIGGMIFLYLINPWIERLFGRVTPIIRGWTTWALVVMALDWLLAWGRW